MYDVNSCYIGSLIHWTDQQRRWIVATSKHQSHWRRSTDCQRWVQHQLTGVAYPLARSCVPSSGVWPEHVRENGFRKSMNMFKECEALPAKWAEETCAFSHNGVSKEIVPARMRRWYVMCNAWSFRSSDCSRVHASASYKRTTETTRALYSRSFAVRLSLCCRPCSQLNQNVRLPPVLEESCHCQGTWSVL